jgi:hypothetical protein
MLQKLNEWLPTILKIIAALAALLATGNAAQAQVVGFDTSELWKILTPAVAAVAAGGGAVAHARYSATSADWKVDARAQLADLLIASIQNGDVGARALILPLIDHFGSGSPVVPIKPPATA